jgi:hypothetical protein
VHRGLRIVTVTVGVWVSVAVAARADPILFEFQGHVDETTGTVPQAVGDLLFGSVTFDIPRNGRAARFSLRVLPNATKCSWVELHAVLCSRTVFIAATGPAAIGVLLRARRKRRP